MAGNGRNGRLTDIDREARDAPSDGIHAKIALLDAVILMSPVFTVVLGVLLLGDRLDLHMIVGAAITLVGVLIIALRPNRVMPRALLIRERM